MRPILVLTIMLAHSSSWGSQWLPLDEKKALCHDSIVVFVGTYNGLEKEKYFSVRFPEEKNSTAKEYWFDIGTFSVSEIIKFDAKRTTYQKDNLQSKLTTLVDGECKGGPCNNNKALSTGKVGIWLIQLQHPNSGDFYLNPHPSNPLDLSHLKEVKKILKSCKT